MGFLRVSLPDLRLTRYWAELGWVEDSGIHMSRTPGFARSAAPPAGEHLFEVLTEILGRNPDEAADLIATGIFR